MIHAISIAFFVNAPTIVFLLLFNLSDNRVAAAFAGMVLAHAVLLSGHRQTAIVKGLNLHFAFIVPVLFVMWHYGPEPVVCWIETWVMATVVWAAAGSVAYAVWRGTLPVLIGPVALLAFGWTLLVPHNQLLTIAAPVVLLSLAIRWLGFGNVSVVLLAMGLVTDVEEIA